MVATAQTVNLNDSTPAAPTGSTNVKFQKDGSGNISAYVPTASGGSSGTVTYTTSTTGSVGDNGKLVVMNCSSACSYTLPATQPSATWKVSLQSQGTTVATVALAGGATFNGGTFAPALNPFRVIPIWSNSSIATDYNGEASLIAGANISISSSSSKLIISSQGSVQSVNGKTGAIALNSFDVGATAGPIAGNSFWPYSTIGGLTYNQTQARIPYVTPVDTSCLQVVWANSYDKLEASGPEYTLKAAIEYQGTTYPVFFNGARSTVVSPKGITRSDPVCIDVIGRVVFYVRQIMTKTNPADTQQWPWNYQTGQMVSGVGTLGSNADATGKFDGAEIIKAGTFTDGVTNGTTTFTSASAPFLSSGIGTNVNVCGTDYTINAFSSTSSVTLSGSPNCGSSQTFTTSIIDKTLTGTIQNATGLNVPAPLAVLGIPKGTVQTVGLVGDSITEVVGACQVTVSGCTVPVGTWAVQAISQTNLGLGYATAIMPNIPYINSSNSGETVANLVANHQDRFAFLGLTKKVLGMLGTNDTFVTSASAATTEGNLLKLWGQQAARGSAPYYGTIVPQTTSTDGWITAGNQTVKAQESVRIALNAWMRDGAPMDCATSDTLHGIFAPAATGSSSATVVRTNFYSNGSLTTPASSGASATCTHPAAAGGTFELANAVEVNSANVPTQDGGFWRADPNVRTVTNCSAPTGANQTVTCTGATFTSGDSNRAVSLAGAGTSGANLVATITYLTATTARVNGTIATAVSGTSMTVDGGINSNTTGRYNTGDGIHPSYHGHYAMGVMTAAAPVAQWTW